MRMGYRHRCGQATSCQIDFKPAPQRIGIHADAEACAVEHIGDRGRVARRNTHRRCQFIHGPLQSMSTVLLTRRPSLWGIVLFHRRSFLVLRGERVGFDGCLIQARSDFLAVICNALVAGLAAASRA